MSAGFDELRPPLGDLIARRSAKVSSAAAGVARIHAGGSSGPGLKPDRLHDADVWVLPNPSGRNRAYPGFESNLVWYRALADHLHSGARAVPTHVRTP